jgi:hypothetical protein
MSAGRRLPLAGTIAASKLALAAAWGSSSSSWSTSMYYPHQASEWMYDSKTIAMKVEGCVWTTTDDNEDVGCMQDSSNDGTTYWYQMAMCRRAQVAYSVYATDSSSATCTSGTFKGTVSIIYENAYSGLDSPRLPHKLTPLLPLFNPTFSVCDTGWTRRICLSHGNIRQLFSHQPGKSRRSPYVRGWIQRLLSLSRLRYRRVFHY